VQHKKLIVLLLVVSNNVFSADRSRLADSLFTSCVQKNGDRIVRHVEPAEIELSVTDFRTVVCIAFNLLVEQALEERSQRGPIVTNHMVISSNSNSYAADVEWTISSLNDHETVLRTTIPYRHLE